MENCLVEEQLKAIKISNRVLSEVKKAISGKDEIITDILISILSRGHILIEDNPGVGKTTLALAFSKALNLKYKRIQFTPDVLPGDITGFSLYNRNTGEFEYKEGTVMCNLTLADEINRASSRTQSALLEAMEEGKVTVDGVTHEIPKPFLVIATQNPIGSIGTQMLPESQLDRFFMRLSVGYPSAESEIELLRARQTHNPLDDIKSVAGREDILDAQKVVDEIYISDEILHYITNLANATRNSSYIKLGLSPRGTLALCGASKAVALLRCRDYVLPDDVGYVFKNVVLHRIIISPAAKVDGLTPEKVLDDIISEVKKPRAV